MKLNFTIILSILLVCFNFSLFAQDDKNISINGDTVIVKFDLKENQAMELIDGLESQYVGISGPYRDAYFEIKKETLQKHASFIIRKDSLGNEYVDYMQLHPIYVEVFDYILKIQKKELQQREILESEIENLYIEIDNLTTLFKEEIKRLENEIQE